MCGRRDENSAMTTQQPQLKRQLTRIVFWSTLVLLLYVLSIGPAFVISQQMGARWDSQPIAIVNAVYWPIWKLGESARPVKDLTWDYIYFWNKLLTAPRPENSYYQ